uniref:Odorant receptor n=1 Tax=Drosophila rhopaloa TaxID=1041015 RepID=A0A6P4FPB2_DRORH
MIFKYIRGPTPGNLFCSRDSVVHLHMGMDQMGWRLPPRTRPYWWLYYIWSFTTTLITFVYLPYGLTMTGIKKMSSFTTSDLFTYVQTPVNMNAAMMKGITVLLMRRRFFRALEIMDLMDNRCTKMQEKMQVHRSVALCNIIVIIYYCVYFGYLTLAVIGALIIGKTPFYLYNPLVDPEEHFYLTTAIETTALSGLILSNILLDVYPIVYVFTLRTHLELLAQRVKNLRRDPDKSEDQNYAELVDCVKDHKLIVEFGNSMRPMISATMFIQLLSVGLILGFAAVSMQFFTTAIERFVSGFYFFGVLFQTFPFCFLCEQVISDCDSLTNTLFHSEWIGAERRYRTVLVYFIHNVQQSITFTAGGIFPICLNTNLKMAKFAFSVVTIVNEMDLVEKLKRE